MHRRLTIVMPDQERRALQELADANMRQPREHLRYLLREEARKYGLLPAETSASEVVGGQTNGNTYAPAAR